MNTLPTGSKVIDVHGMTLANILTVCQECAAVVPNLSPGGDSSSWQRRYPPGAKRDRGD